MKYPNLIEIEDIDVNEVVARGKLRSMPLTKKNSRAHVRNSSVLSGMTNTPSMFTDRYDVKPSKLDWSV